MKNLILFLSLFLIGASVGFAESYKDVSTDSKYYEAVEYLTEKGVVNGYADGTFKPDVLVNRAEAIKMVALAFALSPSGSEVRAFPDVRSTDWFYDFVMKAASRSVVSGYNDGSFKPGQTVNFAESLKMALLAGEFQVPDSVSSDVYRDVRSSDWFAGYFVFGRDNNIIQSNLEGKVVPDKLMSRGEIAEVVYRMMEVKQSGNAFRVEKTWESFVKPELGIKLNLDNSVWRVNSGEEDVIFWRADGLNNQFSPGLIYDNSGRIWFTIDKNSSEKSKDQYFNNIKSIFSGGAAKEFVISGRDALELVFPTERRVDWYIAMPDGSFLVVYTEFGKGVLGGEIKKNIEAMLRSLVVGAVECDESSVNCGVEDAEQSDSTTDILSKVFANILVEGKGMESLNLLDDKVIIETDVIGVGTGPVDYYYSAEVGYTFKYERAADVILDKRTGSSSQF
ncbi:hypothetical protein CVV38_01915 [Candidatus Peregrinibacteria bacterium HGW-Peregrinibacteria-1]|jgi:hypothetical protein|nr:MAG: hypothetical protein CVV38_01915 [Candidatus Peregrinibacteria bacterium HGW-Peregrinibacteria-1]